MCLIMCIKCEQKYKVTLVELTNGFACECGSKKFVVLSGAGLRGTVEITSH